MGAPENKNSAYIPSAVDVPSVEEIGWRMPLDRQVMLERELGVPVAESPITVDHNPNQLSLTDERTRLNRLSQFIVRRQLTQAA